MYKLFFLLILTICCSKDSTQTNSSISLSQEDISNALEVHNKARADVGVEKLEWSNSLSVDAQKWADNYSFSSQNGEAKFSNSPAKDASTAWYNEINDYKYSAIGSTANESVMIGHYTQMVWKSTTQVGIALARSSSGKEYIVARYSPPGNYFGEYPY